MLDNKIGKYLLLGFIVGLIFGVAATWHTFYSDRVQAREYIAFYKRNLVGNITYLGGSGGKTLFKIDNGKMYSLWPLEVSQHKRTFSQIVQEDDSLVKPAFSDTVTIIKEGKDYNYTFKDLSKY